MHDLQNYHLSLCSEICLSYSIRSCELANPFRLKLFVISESFFRVMPCHIDASVLFCYVTLPLNSNGCDTMLSNMLHISKLVNKSVEYIIGEFLTVQDYEIVNQIQDNSSPRFYWLILLFGK